MAGDGSTYGINQIGDERLWILPLLLSGGHWGLITVELDSATVSFRNSIENEAYGREARRIINSLEQFIQNSEAIVHSPASDKIALRDRKWALTVENCPQQSNSDDCGIYIIVFAIHKIGNLTLPESIDVSLWRHLLRQLLRTGSVVVDVSNDQPTVTDPACDTNMKYAAFTSSGLPVQPIPFPQGAMLLQNPLNCFKSFDKRLSSDLADARKQVHLSVDTLQCLERIHKQVAAFHEQNVQEQREMLEATRVHQEMISMYSCLVASRSGNLDVLLDTELHHCENRYEWKREVVGGLIETAESWELSVQTCRTLCNHRRGLVDSRTKALRDFLNELRGWSERQRVLMHDIEALETDIAATIKL